jgi:hypothetical protein
MARGSGRTGPVDLDVNCTPHATKASGISRSTYSCYVGAKLPLLVASNTQVLVPVIIKTLLDFGV